MFSVKSGNTLSQNFFAPFLDLDWTELERQTKDILLLHIQEIFKYIYLKSPRSSCN